MRERHRQTQRSLARCVLFTLTVLCLTGNASAQETWFRTMAGQSPAGDDNGTGSAARFNVPSGIAVDSSGTLYVADTHNCFIRKITPAGVVTALAGNISIEPPCGSADGPANTAQFSFPQGIAVDSTGTVYVADTNNNTIRKITPAGVVSTLAGLAGQGGTTDGTGSAARFSRIRGIAVDSSGTVYVSDFSNHTIRKITAGGVVTTLAGLAGSFGSADGTGNTARFGAPVGIAVDTAGTVYVADSNNHAIRKVTAAGVVTTLAGGSSGFADGTGSAARFALPSGVTVDSAGTVFVADTQNETIRQVTAAGVVTTLAGAAGVLGGLDGIGGGARFNNPQTVTVDSAGTVYVADTSNDTIRKITPGGVVTTLAGFIGSLGSANGFGTVARFAYPFGVAIDSNGNVYVADTTNHTIRKITASGIVTTFAGLAGSSGSSNGTGSAARFNSPQGVAVNNAGTVYVADTRNFTIRQITAGGVVTTLAGSPAMVGSADGIGNAARFRSPSGIAVDSTGALYVADGGNHTIRKITAGGTVTTLAGMAGSSGSADGAVGAARFNGPQGVAVDGAGTVYVADTVNNTIRQITAGVVTTLAGFPGGFGFHDGTGSGARFAGPWGIAVDSTGTLYVGDTFTHTIRQVTAGGVVTKIAGCAECIGTEDYGRFNLPRGIAVDAQGFLYVADSRNNTIRTTAPLRINTGDFDGDGETDVTVYRPTSGTWYILNSNTNHSTYSAFNWGTSTDVPVPADYDGDGKTDIAIFRPSTGQWWILFSASGFTTYTSYTWGVSTDIPVPRDYDGDRKADIVIFRPSIGTWFGLISSDGYAPDSFTWGASGDVPVPGDYDGDGFTDIAVYRPSTGQWWAALTTEDFEDYRAFNWGTTGDVPVPADYDGDGQTDVAIFRPSSGIWYILTSASNYTTFISRTWGMSTDVAVPADYDGDGRADMAIYRNGVWYVLTSTSNFTTYVTYTWGAGGDVPVLNR